MRQFLLSLLLPVLIACNTYKPIARSARENLLDNPALKTAHVGISLYEPASGKYLYDYQGDKYFVPASNTKIATCYAAMKYLGDSLVGARVEDNWQGVRIYGTADPTFLHPDFPYQPVFDFLTIQKGKKVYLVQNTDSNYRSDDLFKAYGPGWTWSDYGESYMPERSFFPIYGNVARFSVNREGRLSVLPHYFSRAVSIIGSDSSAFAVKREWAGNQFYASGLKKGRTEIAVPFRTGESYRIGSYTPATTDSLLSDTLGYNVTNVTAGWQWKHYSMIHSQPTDSLLKPMMHRSDNFFAEQALLMVANEKLGLMSESRLIDTLLTNDFRDLPQQPRWVDGSGLSRYNLFSPRDLVAILNKMKNEFGMARVQTIFPTGNEGTLSNYYKAEQGYLFAKTGTLSGVVAISGFLYTKEKRLLLFSVLVNNHQASATQVRRAVEKWIEGVRAKY